MTGIYNLNKPLGWTPLQALMQLRQIKPELSHTKLSYVGRLDPMASGVQLVIDHPTQERREQVKGFSKTYLTTWILGFSTDSFDLLGLPSTYQQHQKLKLEQAEAALATFIPQYQQAYPPFSSKQVEGKPLFEHALAGTLPTSLPEHPVQIHQARISNINWVDSNQLLKDIQSKLKLVEGNFRQDRIADQWQKQLDYSRQLQSLDLVLSVGSGTYIRQLAVDWAQVLGITAFVWKLKRTQVGDYHLADSLTLAR